MDDIKDTKDLGTSEKTPSTSTPEAPATTEKKDTWSELTGGKYKTPEDLAKAYKEAEKKIGDVSSEVAKSREFAAVIAPLLDEIRSDPKLFAELDQRLRKKTQPASDAQPTDTKPEIEETRSATSDILVASFEQKYGINRLTSDEQKDMREKIGSIVYELTGKSVTTLDLRKLPSVLDHAYVLANKDKLIEKSKLEALANARGNESASISSFPSTGEKGEEALSPEEARTAERLGLAKEQYLEGKKKVQQTHKR